MRAKALNSDRLMDYALRTLGGRAHSMGELRTKLARRAEKREDVDAIMLRLKEAGYLDDRRFAESFAASRLENEGQGRMRVLRDLRQRRVAPNLASQAVEQTFRNTSEPDLVDAYLKRKFRNRDLRTLLSDPRQLASTYRRLRYAGFSAGASISVLKRYTQQAEELELAEPEPPEES